MTVAEKTPIKNGLAREALANGWDLTPLVMEATGLDDRELARVLMVLKSPAVTVDAKRSSMQALIAKVQWHPKESIRGARGRYKDAEFMGLPMRVWRSVLEVEAKRRPGFSGKLVLTATEPTMEEVEPPVGAAYVPVTPVEKEGQTMSQVPAAERKEIWLACTSGGGGPLSYGAAERQFGLKQRNGMTAWRVCRKHEKTRRKKK